MALKFRLERFEFEELPRSSEWMVGSEESSSKFRKSAMPW